MWSKIYRMRLEDPNGTKLPILLDEVFILFLFFLNSLWMDIGINRAVMSNSMPTQKQYLIEQWNSLTSHWDMICQNAMSSAFKNLEAVHIALYHFFKLMRWMFENLSSAYSHSFTLSKVGWLILLMLLAFSCVNER